MTILNFFCILFALFLCSCETNDQANLQKDVAWITMEEPTDTPGSELFTFTHIPDPNTDLWGLLEMQLYIPQSLERIRGIYCYVPGWQGSSMVMIKNKPLRRYVESKGFALMTFTMEGEYTSREEGISSWSGEAFLDGLKKLARKSDHPEIEHAPLLFNGHSAGGQFGYHFTLMHPERVIAFITIKGGLHSSSPAGNATQVPAFMVIGENDEEYRKSNLTNIFNTHRQQKALWAIAIQPNSKHDHVDDAIKHAFFDAVIPLRLPESATTHTTIKLKQVQKSGGWLGNAENFSISSYADYQGDRKKTSWLPNKRFAQLWLHFIQTGQTTVWQ